MRHRARLRRTVPKFGGCGNDGAEQGRWVSAGPSDWSVLKRPCVNAAWRVHDGGTALHGGLPPGYQSWTLSVRATAAHFAARDGPSAPAAAGPKPPDPAPAPSGDMPAPADMGPSSSPATTGAATTGAASRIPRPVSQRRAEATAAFKLLQESFRSGEQGDSQTTSSDEESASSGDGSEALTDSQELSDGSVHSPWQPEFTGSAQSALTGAEAPMGLAAFPTPRPRRWISVAPSAWETPISNAGLGLHSLPILDDSLLLGIPEAASSSRSSAPLRLAPARVSAPAGLADRAETAARTSVPQAVCRWGPPQPTGQPAVRPSVAWPGVPGARSAPGQPAAREAKAAHQVSRQLRRPLSPSLPEEPGSRPGAAACAPADPPAAAPAQRELRLRGGRHKQEMHEDIAPSYSGTSVKSTGSCCKGAQTLTDAESAALCWRGLVAAVSAVLGARQKRLVCLDLLDGTCVLQDAKLEFK